MAKSKLFFDVVASLDGLIAPEGSPLFSGISKVINVKIKEAVASKEVTHVTYGVVR